MDFQKKKHETNTDSVTNSVGSEVFELEKRISQEFDEKFVNPPWFQYSDEFEKI